MKQLRITCTKSLIGSKRDQKATMFSLGLRKMHQSVLRPDNAAVRGMVFKVQHLVAVEEVEGGTDEIA